MPPLATTGDLLSALLLAWLECYPNNLGAAVEAAVGGLQSVLRATAEACGPEAMRAERSAQVRKMDRRKTADCLSASASCVKGFVSELSCCLICRAMVRSGASSNSGGLCACQSF